MYTHTSVQDLSHLNPCLPMLNRKSPHTLLPVYTLYHIYSSSTPGVLIPFSGFYSHFSLVLLSPCFGFRHTLPGFTHTLLRVYSHLTLGFTHTFLWVYTHFTLWVQSHSTPGVLTLYSVYSHFSPGLLTLFYSIYSAFTSGLLELAKSSYCC